MTRIDQRRRMPLDRAISDQTLPAALRRDLSAALQSIENAEVLHAEANKTARTLLEQRDQARRNEPNRLVDLLVRGESIEVDEILDDWPQREAAHDHAAVRANVARVTVDRMWQIASQRVYRDNADDILRTVAASIAEGATPTEAQIDSWQRVTGAFGWHLPTIHPAYRFQRLSADRLTPAMRRTWEALHAGRYEIAEREPGRTLIRLVEYWPELAEPPQ